MAAKEVKFHDSARHRIVAGVNAGEVIFPSTAEMAMKIQRVLDDQAAAWNKKDLPGFMKGYLESDELSFFSGNTKIKGWKATLERYQKRYRGKSH